MEDGCPRPSVLGAAGRAGTPVLHDLVVELGDETFRLKKSFEAADKLGVRFALIVGENEVKAGSFALKNLKTGEQVSVPRADLAARIQAK